MALLKYLLILAFLATSVSVTSGQVPVTKLLAAADPDCLGPLVVSLGERQSATIAFPANDFSGTILPKLSFNGGTIYRDATFVSVTGTTVLSYIGDGNNDAVEYGIAAPFGATHAAVCVSAFTSGSVTPAMFVTVRGPSSTQTAAITTTTPDADAAGMVVRVAGSAGVGSSIASGGTFTSGNTTGTTIFGVRRDTWTDCADGKSCEIGMTPKGALFTTLRGSDGVDPWNTSLAGFGVVIKNVVQQGGKSGAASMGDFIACTNLTQISDIAAGTIEIATLAAAGEFIYYCSLRVHTPIANTVTFKEGTGTNCAGNTATIDGPYVFTANQGFTHASPSGVLQTKVAARAVCATSTANGLTIWGKYAKF